MSDNPSTSVLKAQLLASKMEVGALERLFEPRRVKYNVSEKKASTFGLILFFILFFVIILLVVLAGVIFWVFKIREKERNAIAASKKSQISSGPPVNVVNPAPNDSSETSFIFKNIIVQGSATPFNMRYDGFTEYMYLGPLLGSTGKPTITDRFAYTKRGFLVPTLFNLTQGQNFPTSNLNPGRKQDAYYSSPYIEVNQNLELVLNQGAYSGQFTSLVFSVDISVTIIFERDTGVIVWNKLSTTGENKNRSLTLTLLGSCSKFNGTSIQQLPGKTGYNIAENNVSYGPAFTLIPRTKTVNIRATQGMDLNLNDPNGPVTKIDLHVFVGTPEVENGSIKDEVIFPDPAPLIKLETIGLSYRLS